MRNEAETSLPKSNYKRNYSEKTSVIKIIVKIVSFFNLSTVPSKNIAFLFALIFFKFILLLGNI